MIRSSTIPQHTKSAPLPRGALFVCLPKDSPTRHELLSRIVILNGEKRGGKAASLQAFPAWGRDTASAALGCFRMQNKCAALSPILPAVFHTMSALSAPTGHLPLEGKAAIGEYHLLKKAAHHPGEPIRSPSTVIPSAAEGSLLHCRHRHTCALTQTTPWCFLFRLSLTHGLPVCKKDSSTSVGMTFKGNG